MNILFATDGSEYSDGTARFLARFDFSQTDEIVVVHVIPGVPFPHSGGPYNAALMQLGDELAPRIIDATAELLKGIRANVSTVVTTGHRRGHYVRGRAILFRYDCYGQPRNEGDRLAGLGA
jgi:hypothetical protein